MKMYLWFRKLLRLLQTSFAVLDPRVGHTLEYFLHLSLSSVILIDSSTGTSTWHCFLHYLFIRQLLCFLVVTALGC